MKIKILFLTICILLFCNNVVNAQSAGVPVSEYNSLKELYNSTNGNNWTNNTNWLDTTSSTVADWYGVTVESGHVTKIELQGNNLQEDIFANQLYLPELQVLDISNNKLDVANFSNLSETIKLTTLKIENNNFIFQPIKPVFQLSYYSGLKESFIYSPQAKVGNSVDIAKSTGENYEFNISSEYISENDRFQWYMYPDILLEGKTTSSLQFSPVTKADSGSYYLEITNPDVPSLTLKSNYKSLFVTTPKGIGVPLSEYNALVDFYNSLDGDRWLRNDNWLDTINYTIGDWFGITVEDSHVTEIYFDAYKRYNLNGSIPNSIKDLTELKTLKIITDNVSGELPSGLFELINLEVLYIAECEISGNLPQEIGNLTKLKTLGLEANKIEGTIPTEIGNLTSLEFLSLYENRISGELPKSISQLTNLYYLGLAYNNLSGTIPSSFGNLSELEWLLLNNNLLVGPLPIELSDLTRIIKFTINNNFIGTIDNPNKSANLKSTETGNNRQIPDELADLILIDTLYLGNNQLQFNDIEPVFSWDNYEDIKDFIYYPQGFIGTTKTVAASTTETLTLFIDSYFPGTSDKYQWYKKSSSIPNANSVTLELVNLQLSDAGEYYCKVSNPVATELTLTSKLITVEVTEKIAGAGIPLSEYNALVAFYNSTNGENWNYKENWLDTINHSVSEWAGIEVVNGHVQSIVQDSNNLVGILPVELLNLKYLELLALVNNNISGNIPINIGELSNLKTFSFNGNNLTGAIPTSFGQINGLYYLGLYKNNLEGTIPSEIGNNTNLEALILGYNRLSGTIPESLGNLNKLRHLNLEHNSLEGTIPASIGNLTELRTLDLSDNQLIGPLPVELENITKVYRIDIDNNLIGNIDSGEKSSSLKSSSVENNRQIPDELADLILIDTLHIGNNQLQFNDIEPVFSWDNFEDIKDFIYYPQDFIGTTKTVAANTTETLSLFIDSYFPGISDKYQWYKNSSSIPNANSVTLELVNLQLSDAGEYYCKVTNPVATELTLTSKLITVDVTEKIAGAGVPLNEYLALIEIYDSTNGAAWNNNENWLDTTFHSVNKWHGVTLENGYVTALDLSGLNLEGNITNLFANFDSLTWLNLNNNKLKGTFSGFESNKSGVLESVQTRELNLEYLNIANNNFIFADLEPAANFLNAIDTFIYAPQPNVGIPLDTAIYKHDTIIFYIENYIPGNSDIYSWFKDGQEITGKNDMSSTIENAALQDSGYYTCTITNSLFPELILHSDTIRLKIIIPVGINAQKLSDLQVYPNPAKNRIFIDTKNENVDLKVFNLAGTLIVEKNDIQSEWIDIKQFSKGVYVFRIIRKNAEIINRKVIFR